MCPLGAKRPGHRHTGLTDLIEASGDELGLNGFLIELLKRGGGVSWRQGAQVPVHRVGVVVPGPQPLEVENTESSKLSHLNGCFRRHHRIHWGSDYRDLEGKRVNRPLQRHILGVAGSA